MVIQSPNKYSKRECSPLVYQYGNVTEFYQNQILLESILHSLNPQSSAHDCQNGSSAFGSFDVISIIQRSELANLENLRISVVIDAPIALPLLLYK
jgi:hypothetical protein